MKFKKFTALLLAALLAGGNVAVLDSGGGVHLTEVGVHLAGQMGLHEGKSHHGYQRDEERHGHLVLEEGAERAAPVAVVGVGRCLGLLFAEAGRGEQLVFRQAGPDSGAVLLQLVQVVFQHSCLLVFHVEQHYRPPSFLPKLMRGSMSTMSRSPRMRPMMPTQA